MVFGPSLNGAGALPCAHQRHHVAGLTGISPFFSFVLAISLIRQTRCVIFDPSRIASMRKGDGVLPLNAPRFLIRWHDCKSDWTRGTGSENSPNLFTFYDFSLVLFDPLDDASEQHVRTLFRVRIGSNPLLSQRFLVLSCVGLECSSC